MYTREDFQEVTSNLMDFLDSFDSEVYERFDNHEEVAEFAEFADPFSIIVITEPLRRGLWRKKEYVDYTRFERRSVLEEEVWDRFRSEINLRMEDFLRENNDSENVYLNQLVGEYKTSVRKSLIKDWKKRYTKTFDKRVAGMDKKRTQIEYKRRMDLPFPFNCVNSLEEQFYFVGDQIVRGRAGDSGGRQMHSVYGLGFAMADVDISTMILVYDRENNLKFVDDRKQFCLAPMQVGSNYDLSYGAVQELIRDTDKLKVNRNPDYSIKDMSVV